MLSRIKGLESVRRYAHALYASRYAALFPADGLFLQQHSGGSGGGGGESGGGESGGNKGFQCLRDQPDVYDGIVDK